MAPWQAVLIGPPHFLENVKELSAYAAQQVIWEGCAVQLGTGIAEAVEVPAQNGTSLDFPGNVTQADVADAVVAGAMLAAKSCGPPNALSYSR